MSYTKRIALCWMIVLFSACEQKSHYQGSHTFATDLGWVAYNEQEFQFTISDTTATYDAILGLHYDTMYPYYNLFLQSTLYDLSKEYMHTSNKEIILFEPQTGRPLGSGSSGYFFHEDTLFQNMHFGKIGIYKLSMQQIMRMDTLKGIYRIGLRIEHTP